MSAKGWRLTVGGSLLAAVGGATALGGAVQMQLSDSTSSPNVPPSAAAVADPGTSPALADSLVAARDLFRASRTPAPVPFDPQGTQPDAVLQEQRPTFGLAGLVLGPSRAALLRGIPGLDGVQVIGEGDEVAGLRLISVSDSGVTVMWRGERLWVGLPQEDGR